MAKTISNAPSLGLRIYDVGIELNVKSIFSEWVEENGKKSFKCETRETDAKVAYADCVIMGYRDNLADYEHTLSFLNRNIGKSYSEIKNLSSVYFSTKKKVFFKKIRLYWYSPSTSGCQYSNYGMRDIVMRLRGDDDKVLKYLAFADTSADHALKLLRSIKEKHDAGEHLTLRAKFDKCGTRSFIRSMPMGNSRMWKDENGGKRWREELHGRVFRMYMEYRSKADADDTGILDLDLDLEFLAQEDEHSCTVDEDYIQELD